MLSFHWATLLPAISPQSRIILVRVRLVTTSSTFHLPPPILSPRYEKNQYHRRHESIKLQRQIAKAYTALTPFPYTKTLSIYANSSIPLDKIHYTNLMSAIVRGPNHQHKLIRSDPIYKSLLGKIVTINFSNPKFFEPQQLGIIAHALGQLQDTSSLSHDFFNQLDSRKDELARWCSNRDKSNIVWGCVETNFISTTLVETLVNTTPRLPLDGNDLRTVCHAIATTFQRRHLVDLVETCSIPQRAKTFYPFLDALSYRLSVIKSSLVDTRDVYAIINLFTVLRHKSKLSVVNLLVDDETFSLSTPLTIANILRIVHNDLEMNENDTIYDLVMEERDRVSKNGSAFAISTICYILTEGAYSRVGEFLDAVRSHGLFELASTGKELDIGMVLYSFAKAGKFSETEKRFCARLFQKVNANENFRERYDHLLEKENTTHHSAVVDPDFLHNVFKLD
ncbi:hypothetical protein ScalyP_jg9457 [Parmales sp. scaly parma]|nr:hypothetical protein ScalyP_jg9457 [Parmales sp. scaly parma]